MLLVLGRVRLPRPAVDPVLGQHRARAARAVLRIERHLDRAVGARRPGEASDRLRRLPRRPAAPSVCAGSTFGSAASSVAKYSTDVVARLARCVNGAVVRPRRRRRRSGTRSCRCRRTARRRPSSVTVGAVLYHPSLPSGSRRAHRRRRLRRHAIGAVDAEVQEARRVLGVRAVGGLHAELAASRGRRGRRSALAIGFHSSPSSEPSAMYMPVAVGAHAQVRLARRPLRTSARPGCPGPSVARRDVLEPPRRALVDVDDLRERVRVLALPQDEARLLALVGELARPRSAWSTIHVLVAARP